MDSESSTLSIRWAAVTLGVVAIIIVASVALAMMWPQKDVSNFKECISAGGSRMESYPEQCLYDGKTYVNEAQRSLDKETGYVGMTEDEALSTASDNKVPARVVERDNKSLPVTMDFVYGRHNFHVRDGQVYRVDIEGEDSPLVE